jgi:serine/threonine-protein kinase
MNTSRSSLTSDVTAAATVPDGRASSPLYGRKLVVIRGIWVLITIVVLGLVITGIPIRYEKVRTADPNIRTPEFRDLIEAGVHPEVAAAYDLGAGLLLFVVLFATGIFLFLRASDSREAILLSSTLILYAASFSGLTSVHRTSGAPYSQSLVGSLTTLQFFLQTSSVFIAIFWLPEGRFISRWAAWFTGFLVIIIGGLYFLVGFPRSHDLVNIVALPTVTIGAGAQVYHYRRINNPVTRQQIKWAVIGIVVAALGFVVWQTAALSLGDRAGLTPRVVMVLARIVQIMCWMAVPVGFAIAILRYRLWQVDLVINRSLVYGTVTLLLALVFLGGGFGLQSALGQDNVPIALAISTIGAGLLFNPARRQAQRFVDRRIYGFRFDLNELNRAQRTPDVQNPGVLTGRTLGKYRLLGVLGRGGMGEVYQGEAGGRMVAIKALPQELARREFLKSFERESEILAQVNHPNIVKFHECGVGDGVYYIVLDFIQGRDLSEIIRDRGRIPFDEVRPILEDLATALDYAHERGLVHRDIKPSNIMIRRRADGQSFEAVLMDFGIAKTSDARTALTSTGAVGTIGYMAPEQIVVTKTVDRQADIYALGVMAYEMLTGQLPFKGSPAQVLFAHLQQRPTEPVELVPDLPPNVVHGIMRALEKNPEDRFQSAGEFVAALSL